MNESIEGLPSSFRDPSGFLFLDQGVLYRQVNRSYREDFEHFVKSGLCSSLVDAGLLVAHEEVDVPPAESLECFKILRPDPLPFISYPFEWSFSQLQDAALTTLAIQKRSLEHGMSLKDGT
ncbi:MAG: SAM-dependent methyltransferase, partial [Acidobacteriota bacterium]|nr:SAM-dependent methyltransferase [Acidobacteriota bacterium]